MFPVTKRKSFISRLIAGGIAAGAISISPADCLHTQTVDSPAISQIHAVSVVDCLHTQTVDSPAIVVQGTVSGDQGVISQSASMPVIDQVHSISVLDCSHSQAASSPTFAAIIYRGIIYFVSTKKDDTFVSKRRGIM